MRRFIKSTLIGGGYKSHAHVAPSAAKFQHGDQILGSAVIIAPRFALTIRHLFQGGYTDLRLQNEAMLLQQTSVQVSAIHFFEHGTYPTLNPGMAWPEPVGERWRLDEVCIAELASDIVLPSYPALADPKAGMTAVIAGFGRNSNNPTPHGLLFGNVKIAASDSLNPGFWKTEVFKTGDPFPENDDSGCPYYSEDFSEIVGIHSSSLTQNGSYAVFRSFYGVKDWILQKIK